MKAAHGRRAPAAAALGISLRALDRFLAMLPDVPRCAPGRPHADPKETAKP